MRLCRPASRQVTRQGLCARRWPARMGGRRAPWRPSASAAASCSCDLGPPHSASVPPCPQQVRCRWVCPPGVVKFGLTAGSPAFGGWQSLSRCHAKFQSEVHVIEPEADGWVDPGFPLRMQAEALAPLRTRLPARMRNSRPARCSCCGCRSCPQSWRCISPANPKRLSRHPDHSRHRIADNASSPVCQPPCHFDHCRIGSLTNASSPLSATP